MRREQLIIPESSLPREAACCRKSSRPILCGTGAGSRHCVAAWCRRSRQLSLTAVLSMKTPCAWGETRLCFLGRARSQEVTDPPFYSERV